MPSSPQIFCAYDTTDMGFALNMAKDLVPLGIGIKLGMEFVNSFGPQGIERLLKAAPDSVLFIDLKFHDIPNTVAAAVGTLTRAFHPMYINIHASGGRAMIEAAKAACAGQSKLLAVTILTSLDDQTLEEAGYKAGGTVTHVENLAMLSKSAGADGVVCSAHEIEMLRKSAGDDFVLMVPGIRPEGSAHGDQKRVMTPKCALEKGASHLVIGRPITESSNPSASAKAILSEIGSI